MWHRVRAYCSQGRLRRVVRAAHLLPLVAAVALLLEFKLSEHAAAALAELPGVAPPADAASACSGKQVAGQDKAFEVMDHVLLGVSNLGRLLLARAAAAARAAV